MQLNAPDHVTFFTTHSLELGQVVLMIAHSSEGMWPRIEAHLLVERGRVVHRLVQIVYGNQANGLGPGLDHLEQYDLTWAGRDWATDHIEAELRERDLSDASAARSLNLIEENSQRIVELMLRGVLRDKLSEIAGKTTSSDLNNFLRRAERLPPLRVELEEPA